MNNAKPVYLTEEGLAALKEELDKLLHVKRPALAARLHVAIKQGDLSENADYIAAKEEQGFLEGRVLELQSVIRNAQLIEDNHNTDGRIGLGCRVTVLEEGEEETETYHIVGSTEADPSLGKISYESPLGRALLDHREGDAVTVLAPAGKIIFHILAVT
ncbi:MAG: transcription elongation factor GreA [Anaerolineae bacterium]|nr:transcription elongation factor GreA [Anaerolineae bacterium]